MAKKSKYSDSGEVIYFVSNNERTLPSHETIQKEIEEYIPSNYRIVYHHAECERLLEEVQIYYNIEHDGYNRYKIYLRYNVKPGPLGWIIMIAGLIIGVFIGYSFLAEIGVFLGGIVGGIFVGTLFEKSSKGQKEAPEICERIATGIKEYERAHLLSISTR